MPWKKLLAVVQLSVVKILSAGPSNNKPNIPLWPIYLCLNARDSYFQKYLGKGRYMVAIQYTWRLFHRWCFLLLVLLLGHWHFCRVEETFVIMPRGGDRPRLHGINAYGVDCIQSVMETMSNVKTSCCMSYHATGDCGCVMDSAGVWCCESAQNDKERGFALQFVHRATNHTTTRPHHVLLLQVWTATGRCKVLSREWEEAQKGFLAPNLGGNETQIHHSRITPSIAE